MDTPGERISVFRSAPHPCSYFPGRRAQSHFVYAPPSCGRWYESLLSQNWRRSGGIIYRPTCPECRLCLPIRLPVREFVPSPSQVRTLRRNSDLRISLTGDLDRAEALELYCRYQKEWHGAENPPSREEAADFLGNSPVDSALMLYHESQKLLGAGWIDLLDDGVSSVYFAFDPAAAKRRLGVFSLLKEIELARELGKSWLYLGFWIKGCRTMDYKAAYRPHEILAGGRWLRDPDLAALAQVNPPNPGSDAGAGPD